MKRSAKIYLLALLFVLLLCSSARADEIESGEDTRLSGLIKRIKPSIPALDGFCDLAVPSDFIKALKKPIP